MIAEVYVGLRRETRVMVSVRPITPGVGEVVCLECEGRGWWDYMAPEVPAEECVSCKGTGRVLVSC